MSFEFPPYVPPTPDPDAPAPDPVDPAVPLNPPMVGTASPFFRVDGQNRDLVVQSMRTWFARVFLPWVDAWSLFWANWRTKLIADWVAWRDATVSYLNDWIDAASSWIDEHTIKTISASATTLDPGDPATATISGTINDVEIEFGIPRGADGVDGDPGPPGPPGIAEPGAGFTDLHTLAAYGDPGDTHEGVLTPSPSMVGAYTLSGPDGGLWVRIYAGESYMIADRGRLPGEPIDVESDHGVLLDYVLQPGTTGSEVKTLSPAVMMAHGGSAFWVSVRNTNPTPVTAPGGGHSVIVNWRVFLE